MAQFENMRKVDLANGEPAVFFLRQLYYADENANRIGAIVLMNGEPFPLSGTCSGTAIRADGTTVPMTGTVEGNQAYITLIADCYAVEGDIQIFVKLTTGDVTATLAAARGTVRLTETGAVIDPGEIIPSVSALITAINDAVESIPADYSALLAAIAPAYADLSFPVTAGTWCWYSGSLYRAKVDIPASETWTAAHWETAPLSNALAGDVAALKSAINSVADEAAKSPQVRDTSATEPDLDIADPDGNVIVRLADGHIKTKGFDSSEIASRASVTKSTNAQDTDLDIADIEGNVLLRIAGGHIKTSHFDSSLTDQSAVKSVNNTLPDETGNVNVTAQLDPEELQEAVDEYLTKHPVVAAAAGIVSVADYGAVGDGITDDSAAIQNAVDANYDVYFESDKTYYLESTVTINHDIRLHGGKNTVIKTKTPSGGSINPAFAISGTLKKETELTSDYSATGSGDNAGNKFTLDDMTGIDIGDILTVTATDQYYSYSRRYYYLGATLLVSDVYDDHIFANISMPWDITNTSSVSVKIYSAPTAIIENLNFVADLDTIGGYVFVVSLRMCKNSVIRNCSISHSYNCLILTQCVNTMVDCLTLSKSKWDNTISADGYGIYIDSCTNSYIRRLEAICGQGCIDLSGSIPNINTYIQKSNFSSECRTVGLDMHPNSYNLVVEDCVMGGAAITGKAQVNRCRFIQNSRAGGSVAIAYRGDYNPEWTSLRITNCVFDGRLSVQIAESAPQDSVQSYDSLVGNVEIENCFGGALQFIGSISSTVLSNVIKRLAIKNWQSCYEFYHTAGNIIESLEIEDSTFRKTDWINNHNNTLYFDDINYLSLRSVKPKIDRLFVDLQKYGNQYYLPENVSIVFTSDDQNAHYVVCGKNLTSDDPDDYYIGNVSGNYGQALSRTVNTNFNGALTADASGNLVFTQPNNTTPVYFYPKCMVYANEAGTLKMSCVIKNTGTTSGATFRPYIVIVDCDTDKVVGRLNGSDVTASAEGATITYFATLGKHCIAMCYYYCCTPVAQSETTFTSNVAKLYPADFVDDLTYEEYDGSSLDGDGTLLSVSGKNYVMATPTTFNAKFKVDYMEV